MSRRKRRDGAKAVQEVRAAGPSSEDRYHEPQTDILTEIRRLQRTAALVGCVQIAAAEGADLDFADALEVICKLIERSLKGLDELELAMHGGGASKLGAASP